VAAGLIRSAGARHGGEEAGMKLWYQSMFRQAAWGGYPRAYRAVGQGEASVP